MTTLDKATLVEGLKWYDLEALSVIVSLRLERRHAEALRAQRALREANPALWQEFDEASVRVRLNLEGVTL